MDFLLNEAQSRNQQAYRTFARDYVKPLAKQIDEQERFPKETVEKLMSTGYMGIPIPKQYGGAGEDFLSYILCVEEMAKVCAATATILSAHTSLCAGTILKFGNEHQKQTYLTALTSKGKLGAFALTEPSAGTDAGSICTTAVEKDGEYILNGTKVFITNGKEADIYLVVASTRPEKKIKGMSVFLVEKGTPGFSFGKREKKMGIRASATYELFFEDCHIPKENLLGEEGAGFAIAMAGLDEGRIGIAAQALGIAEGALEAAVKFVGERQQFGKNLSDFQNTKFCLAEMSAKIEAARYLVYKAAVTRENGGNYGVDAATAKLTASRAAVEVTEMAVQLHGGYGYSRAFDVERFMRDAKVTEIYEGTSEVMKMVISNALLPKPQKKRFGESEEKESRKIYYETETALDEIVPILKDALARGESIALGLGRGVADEDSMKLAARLGDCLHAPLYVTRPVVTAGLAEEEQMVGQTGKQIQTGIYLALGLSGTAIHMSGVDAACMIAVNRDEQATIVKTADYAVVVDAKTFLEKILKSFLK